MQCEKLVEFKRKTGHCRVTQRNKEDVSLGKWVHAQRACHQSKKLRFDRKGILDEIGFAWKDDGANIIFKQPHKKLWHQQYEKLVEFKRKNGHSKVPYRYKQDKSLGRWVNRQRVMRTLNKMRPGRQELLDKLKFAWKAGPLLVARVSTTNVSGLGLVIGSFHPLERS
jgi:hypothetical protein